MNDALARLRNRQRPTVPERDTSLASGSADISTSRNQESGDPESRTSEQTETTPNKESEQPIESQSQISEAPEVFNSRHPKIETSTLPDLEKFDTKQNTLRMEAELSDRLQTLCRNEGICREVLLEALFEYWETHPDAQPEILFSAQAKNEHRQQIANLKRAQSMMKRFGGGR